MIINSVRNFVDPELLETLNHELLTKPGWLFKGNFWRYHIMNIPTPYYYSELDELTWYGNLPGALDTLTPNWKKLFDSVHEFAGPNFKLMRYALTGHTKGQDQNLHYDASNTLLGTYRSYLIYLNTKWNNAWGGTTDFVINEKLVHQEYPEAGKLIEFDSQILHTAHSANIDNFLRMTIVLHGKIV
jgi:hypothetical protein